MTISLRPRQWNRMSSYLFTAPGHVGYGHIAHDSETARAAILKYRIGQWRNAKKLNAKQRSPQNQSPWNPNHPSLVRYALSRRLVVRHLTGRQQGLRHRVFRRHPIDERQLTQARYPILVPSLYINVSSHDFSAQAELEDIRKKNESLCLQSPVVQSPVAKACSSKSTPRVGIDTMTLMVTEPQVREALLALSPLEQSRLRSKLHSLGVNVRCARCRFRSAYGSGERIEIFIGLSVARSANLKTHGRRHNSYVASYQKLIAIFDLCAEKCAAVGVSLDVLRLKILRLDTFVDAPLSKGMTSYIKLLISNADSSRLRGGLAYANGILGFGKQYGWIFYGKGNLLLQRARNERQELNEPSRQERALLAERGLKEWESLVRLEMRNKGTRAVQAFCKPGKKSQGRSGKAQEGVIQGEPRRVELEENQPGFFLSDLLQCWDELPKRFVETARARCFKYSASPMNQEVEKVQRRMGVPKKRGQLPTCALARFMTNLRSEDRKMGLDLPWDDLGPQDYDEPLPTRCGIDWLSQSMVERLRHHLQASGVYRSGSYSSGKVSYRCQSLRKALLVASVCGGSDMLECLHEMEDKFLSGDAGGAEAGRVGEVEVDAVAVETGRVTEAVVEMAHSSLYAQIPDVAGSDRPTGYPKSSHRASLRYEARSRIIRHRVLNNSTEMLVPLASEIRRTRLKHPQFAREKRRASRRCAKSELVISKRHSS